MGLSKVKLGLLPGFGGTQKACVVVKDVPGFDVNRCLGPMLAEVTALVKEWEPLETLDNAMKKVWHTSRFDNSY